MRSNDKFYIGFLAKVTLSKTQDFGKKKEKKYMKKGCNLLIQCVWPSDNKYIPNKKKDFWP